MTTPTVSRESLGLASTRKEPRNRRRRKNTGDYVLHFERIIKRKTQNAAATIREQWADFAIAALVTAGITIVLAGIFYA